MPSDDSGVSSGAGLSNNQFPSRVRNDLFDAHCGFERGRSKWVFALWQLVKWAFFLTPLPWPSSLKSTILRSFGAQVGRRVYWKPRVNIHLPWKLSVGDFTWVGEEVNIVNFAPVTIGAHCCLSQRAFLCSGNHDYRSPDMRYRHAPITIKEGVWIGAAAFIGPGVTIGTDAVVSACSVANRNIEAGWVCSGNPCKAVRKRWD
jgi:putative colanic acid biosynthesis acetyltransferase WcaF